MCHSHISSTLVLVFFLIISVGLPQGSIYVGKQDVPTSPLAPQAVYGFLIPLPSGNDTTVETLQNSRSRVLVNDLLREKVDVYWTITPQTCLVSPILDFNESYEKMFDQGSFLIPFVGDEYVDALISSIVFDYCIDAELDDWKHPLNGYVLLEDASIPSYKLVEPKIAQHFSTSTRYGWPVYLQIADAGGFLTFDFSLDKETKSLLSSNDYNIFMWPYEPNPARKSEAIKNLMDTEDLNTIRRFVREGGGYVGSCYGAQTASSGFISPFSPLLLSYAYQPDRPIVPFSLVTSMSDTLLRIRPSLLEKTFISTSSIINQSHPLSFGMNDSVKDFFSGPWFVYLGKNSESISVFDTIVLEDEDAPPVIQKIIGTPNWVTSTFGNGTLALFASHPEFVNNISLLFEQRDWPEDHYYGRRVIQNALFYVTALSDHTPLLDHWYPSTFFKDIYHKTVGLSLPYSDTEVFNQTIDYLNDYYSRLWTIQNRSSCLMMMYSETFSDSLLFETESRPLLYSYHISIILKDYVQRGITMLGCLEQLIALDLINHQDFKNSSDDLIYFIEGNIMESTQIYNRTSELLDSIDMRLNTSSLSIGEKAKIVEDAREMIITFESSLKYIPQLYFESVKLTRHHWYQYEALLAS
jgi:hypothetical protein